MIPDASICGFIFAHPEASYPDILRLKGKSIEAYAVKKDSPPPWHIVLCTRAEGSKPAVSDYSDSGTLWTHLTEQPHPGYP